MVDQAEQPVARFESKTTDYDRPRFRATDPYVVLVVFGLPGLILSCITSASIAHTWSIGFFAGAMAVPVVPFAIIWLAFLLIGRQRLLADATNGSPLSLNAHSIAHRTATLSDAGIISAGSAASVTIPWSAVQTVREDACGFTATTAQDATIFIPRRAFDDREQAEAFFRRMTALQAAGGAGPSGEIIYVVSVDERKEGVRTIELSCRPWTSYKRYLNLGRLSSFVIVAWMYYELIQEYTAHRPFVPPYPFWIWELASVAFVGAMLYAVFQTTIGRYYAAVSPDPTSILPSTEGLTISTPEATRLVPWTKIGAVRQTKHLLAADTGADEPPIVIPLRAFASGYECAAFVELLRRRQTGETADAVWPPQPQPYVS